ncbi:nitric-oxide reductase large subunit [bacterium]|nr:nitric-oxide reductase large subunit [bacterium]
MQAHRKLWLALIAVIVLSFATLGYFGREIYRLKPPIPQQLVSADGQVLASAADIQDGQNVWQSIGGQEVGSIWGHGAYQAPDWSADYLHRQANFMLNLWAEREDGQAFESLSSERKAALESRLRAELRRNTYDEASGNISISADRALAYQALAGYYGSIFGKEEEFTSEAAALADGGMSLSRIRESYAIPRDSIPDPERRAKLSAFFFWAAWACITERPESSVAGTSIGNSTPGVTYSNNWPPDRQLGNVPTGSIVLWSMLSIILLIAGVGALVWNHARQKQEEALSPPEDNPLKSLVLTPSMKATLKYFWVVAALFLAQVGLGVLTAHYTVEGNGFYGFPLAEILPYAVTRTWHTQIGIFWIATAWLATGLFLAPAVSGYEPKYQKLGVNTLFGALLVIVVGSMAGTWAGVMQKLGYSANFWFGHQGYEYVDLGRFWQLFLFAGLFIWLGLMAAALWPALMKPSQNRSMLWLFTASCVAIASFYGAGLMWGQHTHLSMAEYWRWWVVHLWVEGFFEVFATVAIAFLFVRLGLIRAVSATASVLFSTTIFLAGGILGTFHHLYFTGTPTSVLALGAVFSALEIVPLSLVGFEAFENLRLSRQRDWLAQYRWPVFFFVSVAFWNLVGAGVFGFLINPPVALYYMQGLNLTPVHGHTALFGVYGMLGIGLMLFCLRALKGQKDWNPRWLAASFWCLNIGLAMMAILSLLPVGILQAMASVEHGMWFARSAEFLQTPLMENLRWLRVPGDIVFGLGVLFLAWFVLGLESGHSYASERVAASQTRSSGKLAQARLKP